MEQTRSIDSLAETTALPFEPSDPHDPQWSPSEIEWLVGRQNLHGHRYTYYSLPEKIPPMPMLELPACPILADYPRPDQQ